MEEDGIEYLFDRFLYRDVQMNKDRDMDILEVLTLLAKNPTSRSNRIFAIVDRMSD